MRQVRSASLGLRIPGQRSREHPCAQGGAVLSAFEAEHLLLPGPRPLLLSAPLQCAASEIKGPPVRGREMGQSCSGEKRRLSETHVAAQNQSKTHRSQARVRQHSGAGGLARRAGQRALTPAGRHGDCAACRHVQGPRISEAAVPQWAVPWLRLLPQCWDLQIFHPAVDLACLCLPSERYPSFSQRILSLILLFGGELD